MDTKIIGLILLLCSVMLIQYGYEEVVLNFSSAEKKLQLKIEKDTTQNLSPKKIKDHSNIHHVELKYRSKIAHDFLRNHQPKFETSKFGTIWIEVEVIDLPDPDSPGLITQVSVFDLKTNNKISEFGKTYYLKDFQK